MLTLDNRLEAILRRIPKGARVIDIGCDHGKLDVCALLRGIAVSVIATDISYSSLDKARKLAMSYDMGDKLTTRLGDGLEPIAAEEGDTLVLAGMGAREIIAILKHSELSFERYIFSPHSETPELRKYLFKNGYLLKSDDIVKSKGKFYAIIVAERGSEVLSYQEIMLGRSIRNSDYLEFLQAELTRINKLLELVPESDIRYIELVRYQALLAEETDG